MATTLRAGGLAIIGYNADMSDGTGNPATEDKIHFVLTQAITTGTIIYFTDRSWTATPGSSVLGAGTFSNSGTDGTYTWTATRDYAAGEVVSLSQAVLHGAGLNFEHASGEVIWAYQGAVNAPTHFLWALEAGDGNSTFHASLVNTGLTAGVNAASIGGDSAAYVGPSTHAQTFLANGAGVTIQHAIADSANWAMDDQDGQNALEQPVQTQNWFVHHDVDIYGAASGGGNGIVNVGADSTQSAFTLSQQISHLYNNLLNNGVTVFWHPNDIVIDTVRGKFFIADSDATGGHNRILQGNIADLLGNPGTLPTLTVLFSDTGLTVDDQIDNLEIDSANGVVYFSNGTALRKVSYDTANQAGTLLIELDDASNPAGSSNNFIFDIAYNPNTNEMFLLSSRITVFSSSDNPTKNYIYKLTNVSNSNSFTFGNNIALLPFSPDDNDATAGASVMADEAFPKEEGLLEALAIDTINNILYFTTTQYRFDHDGNSGTAVQTVRGAIFSYNLNTGANPNGNFTQIYESTDDGDTNSQTINHSFGPQGLLGDIEVDPVNGKWYVVDETGDQLGSVNPPGDEGIWQGNLNGSGTPVYFGDINNINGLVVTGFTLNNAPTLTGSAAGGLAVTEASSAPNSGETAKVTLFTGITIADPNTSNAGDEITGAVVRIGEGFTFEASSTAPGHTGTVDRLYINNTTSGTLGSGISYTYNQTTGAMVLTGAATVAEYKAAIELVQFSTSGDNVTNDGNSVTRKVYVSVSDGLTMSDELVATVNVTGINDAPVNTPGSAMNFTEDTTGTVGQASPSVIAPVNAITGISIADADADATSETFTVTLGVANGTLTIRTDVAGGLAAGDVVGNGTSSLTLTGTQNEINATLAATTAPAQGSLPNGLVYTPNANFNGADTLTIVTNDQGNNGNDPGSSGTGTTEADTDVKALNVADVNDAPTIAVGGGAVSAADIREDTPLTTNAPTVATLFASQFSDALDDQDQNGANPTGTPGDTLAGIAVVANGSNGNGQWQWSTDGTNWFDIGSVSADSARTYDAAALIRFNPALNYNGAAPTLTVRLIESSATSVSNNGVVDLNPGFGTTGDGAIYTTGTVVLSQNVTAVNDAPVNTVGPTINTTEDAVNVAVTGLSVADVEATGDVHYALNVANGTLTILDNVGGGVGAADITGNGTGSVVITGTIAEINATLAAAGGVRYTPTPNFNGNDTLTAYLNDNGATGEDLNPTSVFDPVVDGTVTEEDLDTRTIAVAAIDDLATPADDTASVDEDDTVEIDVVGNDTDIDNTPVVAKIGTTAISVGNPVTLASGAIVSLGSDGKLTYNPNDKFNYLIPASEAAASGAVNDTATETFTYELADGTTATVTVTINGVDSPEDVLMGDGTDNDIDGTAGTDMFYVNQAGTETVSGLGGLDGFYFGAFLDSTDQVDGGADKDQLGLQGNYGTFGVGATPHLLGAGNLVSIETLALLSGSDTRFGASGSDVFSYHLKTVDENVANGATLTVNMNQLLPGENVIFDGSAETSGAFVFYAGQGTENLSGGAGADGFFFGDGNFGAGDKVDGNGGNDQMGLRGNYNVVFGSDTMVDVETLALLSGKDTRFGPLGPDYSYNITTHDDNVGSGKSLSVNANALRPTESIVFDGSNETDGVFSFKGGQGNDSFTGGSGADWAYGGLGQDVLNGGDGADTFFYNAAAQSTGTTHDRLLDFNFAVDKIDLPGAGPFAYEGTLTGNLSAGSFDSDLAAAMGSVLLDKNDFAFFVATGGDQSGKNFLVVDANGVDGYQAGEDFVFEVTAPPPSPTPDFLM